MAARGNAIIAAARCLAGAAALALAALAAASANAADQSGGLLPVPSATIERGERITAQMLTEKHFYYDPGRPLSVITDPTIAIGKAARRTLVAGKPIPATAFTTHEVVKRGKPTEARFRTGNLSITATVMPLADGGVGDLVQARNMDSGRTVTGVVSPDGAIVVSTP
ncbi:flagellar basal body P-ring formation chaperone FlgA [Acuticoccus sp. MNP-M23]|uniref:flagellar basal body P-ring formation chaperone FlgA n=1 Tax=Acuticoccus sp. MNP-M23 TaxID=3072793 RepID=UPI0028157BA4|nr:flagellar basal body P-ring formation chaperone FlgA [Acuticoccus sp. MNP-M23]WMS41794.1 flagellar basal body P-ring formation chaperone FlgA [Acuticoccus sp. MNP-M23]